MTSRMPIIDVFVGRDGDAWRLYFAPSSWNPGLGDLDRGSIFPVGRPDIAALDRYMWNLGARFERSPTADGGVTIVGKGRSAIALAAWLAKLAVAGPQASGPVRR